MTHNDWMTHTSWLTHTPDGSSRNSGLTPSKMTWPISCTHKMISQGHGSLSATCILSFISSVPGVQYWHKGFSIHWGLHPWCTRRRRERKTAATLQEWGGESFSLHASSSTHLRGEPTRPHSLISIQFSSKVYCRSSLLPCLLAYLSTDQGSHCLYFIRAAYSKLWV